MCVKMNIYCVNSNIFYFLCNKYIIYLLFQSAFLKYVPGSSGVRSSSFNLRLILWEAGITVSNKVLECLILRFSKSKLLSSEAYVIVMIRLHLAHGKNLLKLFYYLPHFFMKQKFI